MSVTSLALDTSAGAAFLAAVIAAAAAIRRLRETRGAGFRPFAEPGVYWEPELAYIHKSVRGWGSLGATLLGMVMLVVGWREGSRARSARRADDARRDLVVQRGLYQQLVEVIDTGRSDQALIQEAFEEKAKRLLELALEDNRAAIRQDAYRLAVFSGIAGAALSLLITLLVHPLN